jgi:hypothetical protein
MVRCRTPLGPIVLTIMRDGAVRGRVIEVAHRLGVSPQSLHSCTAAQLHGFGCPVLSAVGRQIGPGVARLGVGQGLLVPVRVARSWEAEHRSLPGRGPLDDLEPV